MNHIYRIVFNRSLGVYQCVSEIAKAQGKSSGRSATTNRRAGFSVRALSVSILSVLALGTTTGAVATVYDGGITYDLGPLWTVSPMPGDVVTDPGTLVKADNLLISETRLLVTNKGAVRIANDVNMVKQSYLDITDEGVVRARYINLGNEVGSDAHLTMTGSNSNLTTNTNLSVGLFGEGHATIADGASAQTRNTHIGTERTGEGTLTVTGSDSRLTASVNLGVGLFGEGHAIISDGGVVKATSNTYVGVYRTGTGDLTVTGNNSRLDTGILHIGREGKGSVTIADGGSVVSNNTYVGSFKDSEGDLTVTGANSKLFVFNDLKVGNGGKGSVTIADGGSAEASKLVLGDQSTGEGDLAVTGSNSKLLVYNDLKVENGGRGSVTIADGGSVKAGYVDISDLTVTGANSKLTADGLVVGYEGTGHATIADGGSVEAYTGYINASDLIVTGANSKLATDLLSVGKGTIADGGLVQAQHGSVGDLSITGRSRLVANSVSIGKGTIADGGGLAFNQLIVGDLTVTGPNSFLSPYNQVIYGGNSLYVGDRGKGSLIVAEGASVVGNTTYVGNFKGSEGELTVTGPNSSLDAVDLKVGNGGKGSVTIADGAYAVSNHTYVGDFKDSEGDLTVTGANSKLVGYLSFIGSQGKGSVTIADGGSFEQLESTIAESVILGRDSTGEGTLTVTGANSKLTADGLVVGNYGKGTLNIIDNGQVTAKSVGKSQNSKLSMINFDNGTLKLAADQSALFNSFTNANTINLAVGGGTIDTNTFDVSVFDEARITGSGSFTKAGTGTLAMNSATKAWGGDTHINQGVLQLNGDYTMRDGEVLGIGLNTLTDYGQLKVTGNADISQGTLQVNAAEAVQSLAGATLWNNVVSANNLTGKFVAVSDNSLLVNFLTDYSDANSVHLKMVRDANFVDAVESEANQTALGLAGVLDLSIADRLDNNANELADALISSTINFDKPKLAAAANELQPLLMGATNRIITDTNYAVTEAVTERSLTTPKRGVWAKIVGSDSSLNEDDFITGYDADSYGAIVGIDSPINDRLSLGVAVSYIDNDVDSDSRTLDHEMRAKNWQVLGYGNYAASDATQVNFHAGAGSSDVKGKRHITILTNATASSDYSVDTLQAGFGIGHQIGNELRSVTPFAQMNYARAKSDGYRETGAGVYNLNVDENTYESMRWTAGVKMSQALTPKLALTGQLAAALENGDRRSDITANFIELPDASFTTSGQEIGREIGIVGVGLSYMPTANTKLSAGYRGKWRDNYNDQGASIALQTFF